VRWKFKDINFNQEKARQIDLANEIIEIYQAQHLKLTLRQLYYQFVTRNAAPNTERSYKNLGKLISDARLAGLIDWGAIEDRVRVPKAPNEFNDLRELVNAALNSYRLPRWKGQLEYVELWVEKDALSGVLAPLAEQYHVTLMVNRGYSSQSAMYEAASRFLTAGTDKECHLLYLGDHDPSGEDMVRDIHDRLDMFLASVEVNKVALTMDQVEQYDPPPNPAKLTDSRAASYIAEHGEYSWEVDALPPDVLHNLIEEAILDHVDLEKMDGIQAQEVSDKEALIAATENIMQDQEDDDEQPEK
jgi:hypothetical protein